MKISTKGQYAVEIVVDLALNSDCDHLESLKSVAERRKLSEKYLERIVKALKQKKILRSVRGAYGGYCLEKNPKDITVKEILIAVEGELTPVHCLTEKGICALPCDLCPTRSTWKTLWEIITDTANQVTIGQIINRELEMEKEKSPA